MNSYRKKLIEFIEFGRKELCPNDQLLHMNEPTLSRLGLFGLGLGLAHVEVFSLLGPDCTVEEVVPISQTSEFVKFNIDNLII